MGNISSTQSRRIGLDILKIISMVMVVILHVLSYTGGLKSSFGSKQYLISWLLNSLSYVAVNCFVLVSSYFLIDRRFNKSRLVKLWIQIVTYTGGGYIFLLLIGIIKINVIDLAKCIFPISFGAYWFMQSYFLLYLLFPYINKLINALNQKELISITALIIIIFSIMPTFLPIFGWNEPVGGAGIIWFICLYFIAACYKKCNLGKINKYWYLLIYLVFTLLNVLSIYILNGMGISGVHLYVMFKYNSITVCLASIAIFIFFEKLHLIFSNVNKFIVAINRLTLGVYLWHMHPVLKNLYVTIFESEKIASENHYFIICGILVFSIFAIGILLEFARIKITIIGNKKWRGKCNV